MAETPAERITRLEARLVEHERRLDRADDEFDKIWDRLTGMNRTQVAVLMSICSACVVLLITVGVLGSRL